MKTKYISAIVTLSGGAVASMVGLLCKMPTDIFIKTIFLTLLVFFIIGYIGEKIIAKVVAPAPSRDEAEVFENIEEILRREEEYDEKYNNGKKRKKEIKRIPVN